MRKTLEYSGAYNSLYLVHNNELIDCKVDKMPVQKQMLDERIIEWMAGYSQIDDIIVAGIKIN